MTGTMSNSDSTQRKKGYLAVNPLEAQLLQWCLQRVSDQVLSPANVQTKLALMSKLEDMKMVVPTNEEPTLGTLVSISLIEVLGKLTAEIQKLGVQLAEKNKTEYSLLPTPVEEANPGESAE